MAKKSVSARRLASSIVIFGHRDFDILEGLALDICERTPNLQFILAEQVIAAVEFVLDPIKTGRTVLSKLDNVEKTFIGLKIEHFVRDMLDAPKGIRDLILVGRDVDVKTTVSKNWSWMIPPETYKAEEPCLLIAFDEERRQVWMGLLIARDEYLGKKNRDGKRGILKSAYAHIRWLVEGAPLPKDHWEGINMEQFEKLRKTPGGTKRAAEFFEINLNRPVHRSVLLALLHDQDDPMKRLRGNNGARDVLIDKNIYLLSGKYDANELIKFGIKNIGNKEFIAVKNKT